MPETSLQELKQTVVVEQVSRATIEAEVRAEIGEFIEGVKQYRLPELLRKCGFGDDEEGWVNLSLGEKKILQSIAAAIRRGQKLGIRKMDKSAVSLDDVVEETNAR